MRPHGQGKSRAQRSRGGEGKLRPRRSLGPALGPVGRPRVSHLVAEDLGLLVGGWHRAGGGGGQQAAQARPAAGGGEGGAQHAELSGA